jgi:hypothetical protein
MCRSRVRVRVHPLAQVHVQDTGGASCLGGDRGCGDVVHVCGVSEMNWSCLVTSVGCAVIVVGILAGWVGTLIWLSGRSTKAAAVFLLLTAVAVLTSEFYERLCK